MLSPCEQLNGEQSIQLEEMRRIPLFESTLRHVATKHGPPSMIYFKQSLRSVVFLGLSSCMQIDYSRFLSFFSFIPFFLFLFGRQMQLNHSPISAMVVSRNASTTACLRVRENSKNVFLVLDFAHASVGHSNGNSSTLALVISTSLEQTAARLSGILPVDNHHLVTRDRQWQAQLFTSCTTCMFTPAEGVVLLPGAESSAITESVGLLMVMGDIDDRGGERETSRSRDRDRRHSNQPTGSSRRELWERTPLANGIVSQTMNRRHAGRVGGESSGKSPSTHMERLSLKTTSIPYEQTKRHCRIFFPDDDSSASTNTGPSPVSISSDGSDEGYFECVICFENIPEDEGIHLDPCAHGFCRNCLAGHVCSKIEERKFPVFCPLCIAEQQNASPSGK